MKCTFYRPANNNTNEFENIIGKLRYDVLTLNQETADSLNIYNYVLRLSEEAQPLEKNPAMMFWGMDKPERMPGDIRVEYFYKPTYIATAFLMKAAVLFPELMEDDDLDWEFGSECINLFKKVLPAAMLGCTGRGFMGSGYDDVKGLFDTLTIFAEGNAKSFVEKYPDVCPEFTKMFNETVQMLRDKVNEGSGHDSWGTNYIPRATSVLKAIDAE